MVGHRRVLDLHKFGNVRAKKGGKDRDYKVQSKIK